MFSTSKAPATFCRTCHRLGILSLLFVGVWVRAVEVIPSDLRCEYLADPVGLDVCKPRLSWKLTAASPALRGVRQRAYQIMVAGSPELLAKDKGDMWDSGKISTDISLNIPFGGKPLVSRQELFWKVRVWDGNRKPTAWSEPARWEMGLLKSGDWQARWIDARITMSGAVPESGETLDYLRKDFTLNRPISKVRLYATALGLYELHLNGQRVGDHLFAPDWTDYNQRVRYQVYDVTALIRPGANTLAGLVGNGWYCGHIGNGGFQAWGKVPALFVQLEVTYTDGSVDRVVTDGSW